MRTTRVWFEDLAALCEGLERLRIVSPPSFAGEGQGGGASAEGSTVPQQVRKPVPIMTVEEQTQLPA
jgi:hypothetical protein